MALVLHYHPLSSYCHKVLIALNEMDLPFEGRLLNLGEAKQKDAFLALWPTGKMPLLEDAGRAVPESSVIIEYLQQQYPDTTRLLSADPAACLAVRLWGRLSDQYVMTPMQVVVAQQLRAPAERDEQATQQARATLAMAYDLIERQLGEQEWLAGADFSLADCAATPALFYARTIAPFGEQRGRLSAYFERLLTRPSVARVLDEAGPFLQYYPFQAALEPRFTARRG